MAEWLRHRIANPVTGVRLPLVALDSLSQQCVGSLDRLTLGTSGPAKRGVAPAGE